MTPEFEGPDNAPTAIDLFAGCGGFTYGLMNSGFRVKAAWEKATPEFGTYHQHHCQANDITLFRDATDVDASKAPDELTLLAGGPPCQGLSSNQGETNSDDPRNQLLFTMVDWAEATNPQLIAIENVTGLRTCHTRLLDALTSDLEDLGYEVGVISLNAASYGVPQTRERLFVLGVRNDLSPPDQWEPPRVCNEGQQRLSDLRRSGWPASYLTVKEAVKDLPEPLEPASPSEDPIHHTLAERPSIDDNQLTRARVDPNTVSGFITRDGEQQWMPTNHVAQDHGTDHREKMARYPLGHTGPPTTARRLHPDEPAPTMTNSSGTPPVHYQGAAPSQEGNSANVRRLTVREVARIQTFLDEYTFAGTRGEQYRMVCNAVPPALAYHIGRHLRTEILEAQTSYSSTNQLAGRASAPESA
ncbi:DNA cytosine methyltransferase [Haloarcula sp. K1]|jgi:DNA (cytosine-5)-methyltransferase 1|uniref:DNA cytosine methyltransferase n=1 Tax=Haloarcula sp. K1 TaxID=1622207 RepID=UPI0009B59FD1